MAYDEGLAERVRSLIEERGGGKEKKMFGGLAFMVRGHMCFGVVGDELMIRVGPDAYEAALREHGAREMDFTGRPLRGMVFVGNDELTEDEALAAWLDRGLAFVRTLPPR